jgi:hypothetical protein
MKNALKSAKLINVHKSVKLINVHKSAKLINVHTGPLPTRRPMVKEEIST